jgi:hypothetical protein
MTRPILFLILVFFVTIAFNKANACFCMGGGGPACQQAWDKSVDAVFLGRVEKIEPSRNGKWGLPPGAASMTMMGRVNEVSISVEESYRGVSTKTIQVYTESSGAGCGYGFKQGERYVVFASKAPDEKLIVSLCSATRPVQYAAEDLAYLRSIPSLPLTATIKGTAWKYTHDPNFKPKLQPSLMDHYRPAEQDYMAMSPESGMTVIIKSQEGAEHSVTVDAKGNWQIADLSPGIYEVHPHIDESTYIYPLPKILEVSPRGCSQVDIRVESNGRISGVLEHGAPQKDWALIKVFVLTLPNPDWHHPAKEVTLEPNQSTFEIGPLPAGTYALGVYLVKTLGTPERYTLVDFGRNYYPGGVYDPNLAQPIDVADGKEVKGVRFKMPY